MEYKAINGFRNYWINSMGYVLYKYRGEYKITTGIQHKDGRYRVLLCDGRVNRNKRHNINLSIVRLDKLVAEYFVPNPNEYKYIKFKDMNYRHNFASNLEWTDEKERKYIRHYGTILFPIEGIFPYLISADKEVYSMKSGETKKMKRTPYGSYALVYKGKQKIFKPKELWERRIEDYDKDTYLETAEKSAEKLFKEKTDLRYKDKVYKPIVHLPTGERFEDKYEAEEKVEVSVSNINNHLNGTVKNYRWIYEEKLGEEYNINSDTSAKEYEEKMKGSGGTCTVRRILHIETGEVYNTVEDAAYDNSCSVSKVYGHCYENVDNPEFKWIV